MGLSPAAQAFWGSIIRRVLTIAATLLVAHGYVNQSNANAYVEELVGIIINGAIFVWANRVTYWQKIHELVGHSMPAGVTQEQVSSKVVELKTLGALPSVFTPIDEQPKGN